ncbi:MAG: hypothetical protein O2797_02130 [Bacteroidetes bacterium]|nr:hypothetical protein [Bacteroidota bacterium]
MPEYKVTKTGDRRMVVVSRWLTIFLLVTLWGGCDSSSPSLGVRWNLPERPSDAQVASSLVDEWAELDLEAREEGAINEILAGNVPSWYRQLVPIKASRSGSQGFVVVTFHVLPDYLAVGSDDDFLYIPLSPQAAQRIADTTGMSLPTPLMVDLVWQAADNQFEPRPIPPSPAMTTLRVFVQHNQMLTSQRDSLGNGPSGLRAGHKKDVVVTSRLNGVDGKVAIYGWHQTDGIPIQPVYTGHTDRWVDYSHGIRLVSRDVLVDGKTMDIRDVLADPDLARLFSSEGVVLKPFYELSQ